MPFELASESLPRAKIFLYGEAGTGKTTFALRWGSVGGKIAVIDLDGGTNRYDTEFEFYRWKPTPTTIEEIWAIIDFLSTKEHEFTTLHIDTLTAVYDLLLQYWDKHFMKVRVGKKGHHGSFYEMAPLDFKLVNRSWSRMFLRLRNMDLNVICTARSKMLYDTTSETMMKVIGKTFDSQKTTDYEFDSCFQTTRIVETGQYIFNTDKHRSWKNPMPAKIDVTGFNMEFFQKYYGDSMTRKAIPVRYVTQELIDKIEFLLVTLKVNEATRQAALVNYGVSDIADLKLEQGTKIVEALEKKVKDVTPF